MVSMHWVLLVFFCSLQKVKFGDFLLLGWFFFLLEYLYAAYLCLLTCIFKASFFITIEISSL